MNISDEAKKQRNKYYKEYRLANAEKIKSYYREWRKNNPEKVKEYTARYWEKQAKKEGGD